MSKEIIFTDKAPKSLAGYSQAVKAGDLIFVAGQGPFDPVTGEVHGNSIQEQTGQCLRNIQAILQAAGSSLDKVVSATFIMAVVNYRREIFGWAMFDWVFRPVNSITVSDRLAYHP